MTNLYALIVGIEKYDQPDWNRSGPVAGAIEMAYWCQRIGMHPRNIRMFLSLNDQDADWAKEQRSALGRFTKSGVKIVEDTSWETIDTFWRSELPKLPDGDSKLLVYWCGHGVTRPDRDRILLHTDYNTNNLRSRVTSFNDFRATLATQSYQNFREQLIVADVCGDFQGQVSPNPQFPANPVDSIAQHCYFASLDGVSTQIQNGIGEFTESTLEILDQYQGWPDLDTLQNQMDQRFCNGDSKSCKVSIRTPTMDYDDGDRKSDSAFESNSQPNAQEVQLLVDRVKASIKENDFDTIFQSLEKYLANAKSNAFDEPRDSLQILQSDFSIFRTGEINGTLMPDANTHRRTLISRIQKLLKLIESKATSSLKRDLVSVLKKKQKQPKSKPVSDPTNKDSTSQNPSKFFHEHVGNLLEGNNELTRVFFKELFPKGEKVEVKPVVDFLVGPTISTDNDYPLLRLRRLLQDLEDTNKFVDASCRPSLNAIIELLSVASFPPQDRDCVEVAMREVLQSTPLTGSEFALNTTNSKDAEKLLVATRLKLTNRNINGLEFNQLLNFGYREGDPSMPMLDIIHVVPEPTNVPDNESTEDFYAKSILADLNLVQPETAWKESLNHELNARKGRKGDGKVVAMMISQDKKTAIQVLRKEFPLLLVVVLPQKSVVRYSTVFNDRANIEFLLKKTIRQTTK